jgi:hypothetical protein
MKLYKREGRRFVACELIDNIGKYYQLDGTFSDYKTEASIGLCISSSVTEDIVMYLKDGEFKLGTIPTSIIMLKALLEFRQELNLSYYTYYKCINPVNSAAHAAYAYASGLAYYGAASGAYFVAALTRQIIKVRKC